MRSRLPVGLASLALLCVAAGAKPSAKGTGITTKNWIGHPLIKAVRAEVALVDAGMASGNWTMKTTTKFPESCDGFDMSMDLVLDTAGVPRRLTSRYEPGGDGLVIRSFFYDATGGVRFYEETVNWIWGGHRQDRMWFAADHETVLWSELQSESAPSPAAVLRAAKNPKRTFEKGPPPCD